VWLPHALAVAVALFAAPGRAGPAAPATTPERAKPGQPGSATAAGGDQSDDEDDDQAAGPGDAVLLRADLEALLQALNKAPNDQARLDIELTLTPPAVDNKPVPAAQEPSRAEIEASEAPGPSKPGKPGRAGPPHRKTAGPYTKVVKDAGAQVGYREKAGNCTRYGQWYGHGMRCVDWCDIFVSWVYGEAGQLAAIGGKHSFVPAHYAWFRQHKRFHARGSKPCRGCIVFFDLNRNHGLDHIGVVTSYTDTHVYTVEGNRTNQVKRVKYARSSPDIFGYGYPEWKHGRPSA
jgi:hypothetical protein